MGVVATETWLEVERDEIFGCELYLGPCDADGYGRHRGRLAHIILNEERHGPIPDGFEIDHLCRRRACLLDAHHERVTRAEQEKRKRWNYRARRERCAAGHDLRSTAMVTPEGGRVCRTCSRGAKA